MKKLIYLMFLGFLLTSCTETKTGFVDKLSGKYYFEECIYINFLSSSTKDYFTEQHSGEVYIIFDVTSIEYRNINQSIVIYDKVKYKNVSVTENLDDIINLDIDNIFDNFEQRYDIYNDDSYTGLTLFFDGENMFLAEIRIIDDSSNEYFVWDIFSLSFSQ
jgi:hypothetical protein